MIDIAEGPGRDLKNIRQIGTPAEGDRIYIENAAYARVHEETYDISLRLSDFSLRTGG